MQADEVERWKQKIRNSSMAILKDVQKLLACSREGDSDKIASTSSDIAANARELIDTIQEQVSDKTEAGKQVLHTMEQTKKSIVVTMKACEALGAQSTEAEQNALKEECKVVAGNIKLIHQHASALKPSDFVRDESDSEEVIAGTLSPRLKEWLEKVEDLTKQACLALNGLQAAALSKDQPELVSNAKALSQQCSELLQHTRKYKLDALGTSTKESVLQVISSAKAVFQSPEVTPEASGQLQTHTDATKASLDALLKAFESKAGVSANAPIVTPAPSSTEDRPSSSTTSASQTRKSKPGDAQDDDDIDMDDEEDREDATDSVPKPADVLTPKDGIKQLQREFSSRDPEKVFKVQEQLGEGASGAVFRAVHRETKKVVAIKKMQVGVNNITATVKEIKIMKDLKSPYTLKYYGCYNKDNAIWIIMEYCDGGSLQDIIDARENEDVCLTEIQIAQIVAQVLQALEYLHSMKKIHRDIKAGNILLNSQGYAKLADFGISAQQVGDEKRTTTIGSSYWMAPETLMGGGYDSKADIWSLGITIMEMAEGIPPLIEEQPHKAAFRIVNDPPPKLSAPQMWSKSFVDFVSHCLTKNPEHRPSSADLRKHPFIASVGDAKDGIIELINWSQKDKKKRVKKKKSADVEEELNLTVWIEEANTDKTFLLPSHATAEDVCRQCSEAVKMTKDPKSYGLYFVIEEGGKSKEKKMGPYDLPAKILATLQKKFKGKKGKPGAPEPYRFVYKV